jgi:hypothetical protein
MKEEVTMTDGQPAQEKKVSPWGRVAFMEAFWVHRGDEGEQKWEEFYEKMRLSALEDTKGVYALKPHILNLRCKNTNRQLTKAGMKEIPFPAYVSKNPAAAPSVSDIMKQLLDRDGALKVEKRK